MRPESLSRACSNTWRLRTGGLVVVALVLAVAGCRQAGGGSLQERVGKYWELKQAKRWEEVYDGFLDPAAKKGLTREAFLKRRLLAFDILSYQISDVQEDGDKATVEIGNEVNFPLRSPTGEMQLIKKQVTTNDTWVRRDGTWYIDLKE